MSLVSQISSCILILCALGSCIRYLRIRKETFRLPPGPKPLPLLGNVHQIGARYPEKIFAQWSLTYGDITYARFFERPVIILNSLKSTRDLMDKRSAKYSGRPRFVMMAEMLGWKQTLAVLDYGEQWRKQRKWAQVALSDKISQKVWEVAQRKEACVLLLSLASTPGSFMLHLKRYTVSLIMQITYGHTVSSENDEFVSIIEGATMGTVECFAAGGALVDFFPILKLIPSWAPGARFKRRAIEVNHLVQKSMSQPYEMVQKEMALGRAKPSVVSSLLEAASREGTLAKDEEDIKGLSSTLYAAGTDTTTAALATFFLAMTLHPEVMSKAQAEIDRIVGSRRLPEFSDRVNLPYIECVVKEVYRWICPLPLGLPHRVTEDDDYMGYAIPNGTTVLSNIWSISRDKDLYHEAEKFLPERFLAMSPNAMSSADPREYIFGFGRRICPGRQFADASVWLAIASVVATFNIRTAKDIMGNELVPESSYDSGIVSHPHPFACSILPRSSRSIATVMEAKSALDA